MPTAIDLLDTAVALVTRTRHGSPSMLTRRFNQEYGVRINHDTALNLLDQMTDMGITGPDQGAMARKVLMEPEDAAKAVRGKYGSLTPHPPTPQLT
jgi:DNA segregation ATPase FtsK/SpoIIIE-like protein